MPAGRPTKYNKEMLAKAQEYLVNYDADGDVVPSLSGLAVYLDLDLTTVQDWAKHEDKKEFSRTLAKIKTRQHNVALNKGLKGEFNAAITKLLLHNHGYSDKQEVESTNTHKHEITDFAGMSDEEIRAIANQSEG